ncbi:F-box associated protein [Medicago truncatula]|uniref:F-box associated protein n=1 Tax=Medicago truncatula TaxID=3880 RepID=G7ILL9_MEDTR|nr:F-box associated protein [Medicago truncatula]
MHLKEYNTVKMHLNYQVMKRSARNPNLALPIRKRQKYTTPWFCGVVPIPYQYLIYSRINQSPLLGYHPRSGFLIGSYNGLLHFREPQNTHKVVAFRPGGLEVKVFNLGDNIRRDIQSLPVIPYFEINEGVYFSGSIHWLALYNYSHSLYEWAGITIDQFAIIISLNLSTETYNKLLLPRGFNEVTREVPILRVLNNHLCFSHEFKGTHLIIWQMTKYGVEESWNQLLKISHQNLPSIHPHPYWVPLYFSETCDYILIFANKLEDQAILYIWRNNAVERTKIKLKKSMWLYARDYVEIEGKIEERIESGRICNLSKIILYAHADPEAEVISLSPKPLMATNRFVCEICLKDFQRDQNLQLHRRGHNLPWKLKQRTSKKIRKRVYVCPEKIRVHNHPSRALGDLTGIKKHFCRKHGEKKCSKFYVVQSDWKAHS